MAHNTIAIVADCDDTLAPDTTGQLIEALGTPAKEFFDDTMAPLVREGWDPSLAYMHRLAGRFPELTLLQLQQIAQQLRFYPGALAFSHD